VISLAAGSVCPELCPRSVIRYQESSNSITSKQGSFRTSGGSALTHKERREVSWIETLLSESGTSEMSNVRASP
jgi:hypothetical protein